MRLVAARHTTRVLLLQAIAVLGIVAVLGTLPICDAAAYAPFTNASDFRTVTERRDITVVETEPGVRYLHGRTTTGAPTCATCQVPDHADSATDATADTIVERAATLDPGQGTIDPGSPATIDGPDTVTVSRAVAPEIQPPRVATI